jgi:hypothetical protein
MADQRSRGGKKEGTSNPANPEKHQTTGPNPDRPAEGQPGGPKPNAGQTRSEKSGEKSGDKN